MNAHELLRFFISDAKQLYGNGFLVHNVHNLNHLANDVKLFGPLDAYSAFAFENCLGKIKRQIHSGFAALQQIANRLFLEKPPAGKERDLKDQHNFCPFPDVGYYTQ